jgi:citrate lyase beta subunit
MTAISIGLHDYIASLRATMPVDLHPAGMATIFSWFGEMQSAADRGDAATVAKVARMVSAKVALELEWQRQDGTHSAFSVHRVGR